MAKLYVMKRNGKLQEFNVKKLAKKLRNAGSKSRKLPGTLKKWAWRKSVKVIDYKSLSNEATRRLPKKVRAAYLAYRRKHSRY